MLLSSKKAVFNIVVIFVHVGYIWRACTTFFMNGEMYIVLSSSFITAVKQINVFPLRTVYQHETSNINDESQINL